MKNQLEAWCVRVLVLIILATIAYTLYQVLL